MRPCLHHLALMRIQYTTFYRYENIEDYNAVICGVASPAKFPDVLTKVGLEWTGRNLLEELREKETRYTDWEVNEDWYKNLVSLLDSIEARHEH